MPIVYISKIYLHNKFDCFYLYLSQIMPCMHQSEAYQPLFHPFLGQVWQGRDRNMPKIFHDLLFFWFAYNIILDKFMLEGGGGIWKQLEQINQYDLSVEVLTVHCNELCLFWARAFPLRLQYGVGFSWYHTKHKCYVLNYAVFGGQLMFKFF